MQIEDVEWCNHVVGIVEKAMHGPFGFEYNHDHRHSGIRYVSPAQRHAGADYAILQQRHALYCQARERHPRRWSGKTRNWTPIGAVTLNPERNVVVNAGSIDKRAIAA